MSRKQANRQGQQITRYQTMYPPSKRGAVYSSVFQVENSEKIVPKITAPCGHKPPIFSRLRDDSIDMNLLFLQIEYAKTILVRQQLIEAYPWVCCSELVRSTH